MTLTTDHQHDHHQFDQGDVVAAPPIPPPVHGGLGPSASPLAGSASSRRPVRPPSSPSLSSTLTPLRRP